MGYLLDSTGLGHISGGIASHQVCSATSDAAFGSLAYALVAGVETVFVGCSDGLRAVQIAASNNNFTLGWHNTSQASDKPPIVVGGGVWAVSAGGSTLYQYDAGTGNALAGYPISGSNHFTSPSASNGMIFVEGGDTVSAVPAGPNITAVTPAAGPTAGGQTVTVSGVGFKAGMAATIRRRLGVASLDHGHVVHLRDAAGLRGVCERAGLGFTGHEPAQRGGRVQLPYEPCQLHPGHALPHP